MIESNQLLSTKELAIFLNCSEGLIHKLKSQNKIPFIKIGSSVKFEKEEVLKTLKSNTQ